MKRRSVSAAFVIHENTDVFANHRDWLIRRADGSLQQVAPDLLDSSTRRQTGMYALGITHPGAAAWLHQLLDTAANDWGYDFIKIDFVAWTLLAAERYQPSVTKAAAYRKGFENMRKAIGANRHLLDCGPGNISVGLLTP